MILVWLLGSLSKLGYITIFKNRIKLALIYGIWLGFGILVNGSNGSSVTKNCVILPKIGQIHSFVFF